MSCLLYSVGRTLCKVKSVYQAFVQYRSAWRLPSHVGPRTIFPLVWVFRHRPAVSQALRSNDGRQCNITRTALRVGVASPSITGVARLPRLNCPTSATPSPGHLVSPLSHPFTPGNEDHLDLTASHSVSAKRSGPSLPRLHASQFAAASVSGLPSRRRHSKAKLAVLPRTYLL